MLVAMRLRLFVLASLCAISAAGVTLGLLLGLASDRVNYGAGAGAGVQLEGLYDHRGRIQVQPQQAADRCAPV